MKTPALATLTMATLFLGLAAPSAEAMTTCRLQYELSGWSLIVKQYRGSGTVRCDDGESARVTIEALGGGITVGKSSIEDGRGTFSEVRSIEEVFGSYAAAGGHGGATKSAACPTGAS